jgi:hypothetical protein
LNSRGSLQRKSWTPARLNLIAGPSGSRCDFRSVADRAVSDVLLLRRLVKVKEK